MDIVPEYHFNGFRRQKGEKVVAEYVVIDPQQLDAANYKHFPDVPTTALVEANEDIARDFMQTVRLCKTHIADPQVFELCREIERLIAKVIQERFVYFGQDRWMFEEGPLPLKEDTDD